MFVVPLLALVQAPGRERFLRVALMAMMGVNVWTAISVIGARYCYGSPFPW